MPDRAQRRLAAILAIDMVGYSRRMEVDETGTIARMRQHREAIIDPALSEHGGRIVKTMGDGLLVEFSSVVAALDGIVRIQRAIAAREAECPRGSRIEYRAGLNLGDIVIEGDDILGDGVNIAARLEALAEPGGVFVTASVFEQVVGKLDLAFDDLGERHLKNIRKPVRIYRVRLEIMADGPDLAAGGPTAAAKPSIAVLPFVDMSSDRDQEYFADGISEDIITELARNQAFFVTARNSTFTYKGRPVDVKQVAGELGVRYVLEGSVRRGGSRLRITAQLIDATTGNHVWAERYDRELDDVFAVQDEIATSIVGVVAPQLLGAEFERARRTDPAAMGAWDFVMQANWHAMRLTRENNRLAKDLASRAVALDPSMARARVVHAMCDIWDVLYGWAPDPLQALAEAHEMGREAVALDGRDAEAHTILGAVMLFARDFEDAPRRLETALALNANLAAAICGAAAIMPSCPSRPGRASTSRRPCGSALAIRRTTGPMPSSASPTSSTAAIPTPPNGRPRRSICATTFRPATGCWPRAMPWPATRTRPSLPWRICWPWLPAPRSPAPAPAFRGRMRP